MLEQIFSRYLSYKSAPTEEQLRYALDLLDSLSPLFEMQNPQTTLELFCLQRELERLRRGGQLDMFHFFLDTEALLQGKSLPTLRDEGSFYEYSCSKPTELIKLFSGVPRNTQETALYRIAIRIKKFLDSSLASGYDYDRRILSTLLQIQREIFTMHSGGASALSSFLDQLYVESDDHANTSEIPSNCYLRTCLLLAAVRPAIAHLDLYVDFTIVKGTPHVRLVYKACNGSYYAIDKGIRKLNRPPSHLDPPEMVFANLYIEQVLGESPFTLLTTLNQQDKIEAERILSESGAPRGFGQLTPKTQKVTSASEGIYEASINEAIVIPDEFGSENDLALRSPYRGGFRFGSFENISIEDFEADFDEEPLEGIGLFEGGGEGLEGEFEEVLEDYYMPSHWDRFKAIAPTLIGISAFAAASVQGTLDASSVQEPVVKVTVVDRAPEFWTTYQEVIVPVSEEK